MQIEDLLDECLRIQAGGGDVTPLLAQYPELRAEVETLLQLAHNTARVSPPHLDTAARVRITARLRAQMRSSPADEHRVHVRFDSDEFLHVLASRLGATRDEIWRYIGPSGARQLAEFLWLPGYGGMFDALRVLMRALRVLEGQGVPL
jgi:hypothetical protein